MLLLCFYMSHTFDLINDKKKKKAVEISAFEDTIFGKQTSFLRPSSTLLANLKRKQSETIWSRDKPENDRTHTQKVKIRRVHSNSHTSKFMVPWYSDYKDILPKKLLLMIKDPISWKGKDLSEYLKRLPYYLENIFLWCRVLASARKEFIQRYKKI